MVVNGQTNEITDDSLLYFGSHNFSPSAWGNIEKGGTQIGMANWELGVVFPPEEGTRELKQQILDSMTLRLCEPEPAKKYDLQGGDYPFILDK